eukprot:317309-Rhodomonas_salina.2
MYQRAPLTGKQLRVMVCSQLVPHTPRSVPAGRTTYAVVCTSGSEHIRLRQYQLVVARTPRLVAAGSCT